jgi:hypothetical protein
MAIIYSYPETLELLPTDMLIGTATVRVAGKRKNITKNFTLELLKNFILSGNTGVQWGTITGTLSNQTDLQAALNAKQNSITLTTTGSTGPATLVGATLNIPNYSGLSYTFTSPLVDTAGVITINQSSATTDGYLSAANWVTFNSKQNALSGTGFVKISGTTISYDNTTYYPYPTGTTSQYVRGDGSLATFPTSSTPTLNQVLTAGNVSLLDAKIGVLYGYDNNNADYGTLEFYDSGVVMKAAATNQILFYNDGLGSVTFSNGGYNPILNFAGVGNNLYTFQNANGTLAFLSDIPSLAGYVPTSRTLTINGTTYDLTANRTWTIPTGTGTVTSVGLSMPSAFTVSNSPVTSSGTIAVTGAGSTSQYVRGDGTLANFPTSTGGGSSFNYYLNGSISQGTFGGNTYYEMSRTPILGAGTNFTRTNGAGNGYIASFITDAGDPSLLNIPGGNWNLEIYFQSSASGGSPQFYGEIYKVDVANAFTLVASGSANPEGITNGTTVDQYFTSIPVPQTSLLITDRLAIRIYVITGGRTITMHTENGNLCEVLTTFSTGLTALNGLTQQVQYFSVGTSGTDFNISSVTDTHTFNLPTASAANRGALSSTDWSAFNSKFTLPSLTSGSVLFSNGTTIAQDNANFFWDDTNNRLGIGTINPQSRLGVLISDTTSTIAGVSAVTRLMNNGSGNISKIILTDNTISDATISFLPATAGNSTLSFGVQGTTVNYETLNIKENGRVGISTITPATALDVNGVITATGGNSTSWNAKQDAITLTTTGTSGPATLVGTTLNIPEYAGGGGSTPIDIQLFTSSGVWTKPVGASYVEVYLVSGGGGGGSGRRGATLTARYGGGGGSSGAITSAKMNASSLSSTENIWIGTGGNGGAAIAVNDTNGATGSSGLTSYFGGTGTAATSKISTSTGVGGAGGTNASNSGSSSFGSYIFSQLVSSGSYASGSVGSSAFGGAVSGVVLRPLNSGVYGGGITAANAPTAGQGNRITGAASAQIITIANGGAVGSVGDAGSFVTNSASNLFYANGGAGGGSGDILGTVAGGTGGAGAFGAGGAGGGASTNGANSGAGGRGGDGFCMVVTYF